MNPQQLTTTTIDAEVRTILMRRGLVGGQFVLGAGQDQVSAARNSESVDVKLTDAEAAALWKAAARTMSGTPAEGAVFTVPTVFDGDGGPAPMLSNDELRLISANRPKREDYESEPAFYRALVRWEESHGLQPGGAPAGQFANRS